MAIYGLTLRSAATHLEAEWCARRLWREAPEFLQSTPDSSFLGEWLLSRPVIEFLIRPTKANEFQVTNVSKGGIVTLEDQKLSSHKAIRFSLPFRIQCDETGVSVDCFEVEFFDSIREPPDRTAARWQDLWDGIPSGTVIRKGRMGAWSTFF